MLLGLERMRIMDEESEALKQRIGGLTDEELLQMVTVDAIEYRPEALDFAKLELTARRIDYTAESEAAESEKKEVKTPVPVSDFPASERLRATMCPGCGGNVRTGTLVGEKELTIVFGDNREERFLRVNACTQCNQVWLFVDFETDVES
jgi:hypothetical protein